MTTGPMAGRDHAGQVVAFCTCGLYGDAADIPVRMTLGDACRVLGALGYGAGAA